MEPRAPQAFGADRTRTASRTQAASLPRHGRRCPRPSPPGKAPWRAMAACELRQPVTRRGGQADDWHLPIPLAARKECAPLNIGSARGVRPQPCRPCDDDDVGQFITPAFMNWRLSPEAGWMHRTHTVSNEVDIPPRTGPTPTVSHNDPVKTPPAAGRWRRWASSESPPAGRGPPWSGRRRPGLRDRSGFGRGRTRRAPPVRREDGSTATTALVCPSARARRTRRVGQRGLATPGGPGEAEHMRLGAFAAASSRATMSGVPRAIRSRPGF